MSSVKNKTVRLVAQNKVAQSVIKGQQGKHPEWVFPYAYPVAIRTEIADLIDKANRVTALAGKSSPTLVRLQARAA